MIFGCQKMEDTFPNGFGEILMPSIYMIFKGFSNTHRQYLNIIFSRFRKLKNENTVKTFSTMQCPLTTFLQKCAPQIVSVKH